MAILPCVLGRRDHILPHGGGAYHACKASPRYNAPSRCYTQAEEELLLQEVSRLLGAQD